MKIQTHVICMLENNFPLRCLGDIDALAISSGCVRYVRKDILRGSMRSRKAKGISERQSTIYVVRAQVEFTLSSPPMFIDKKLMAFIPFAER
jgi:hypothetical protein